MASTSAQAVPGASTTDRVRPSYMRRHQLTSQSLLLASNNVLKVLDPTSMRQCFPELVPVFEQYYGPVDGPVRLTELINSLDKMLRNHYTQGIPLAWQDMCEQYDWVERADALDEILEQAKISKEAGNPPRNLFTKGTDGRLTIPNATVPVLRQATEELKAKRLALTRENEAIFASIQEDKTAISRTEDQIKEIIQDFTNSMQVLSSIDDSAISALQTEMLAAIPADA